MEKSPVGVHALLNRVFGMMTHPSRARRLGGCLALNRLIVHVREETSLVSRYGLQMLHIALCSLRGAHSDASAAGTAAAAGEAVDRALRVVRKSIGDYADRAQLLR
jgi:hypothetical protein